MSDSTHDPRNDDLSQRATGELVTSGNVALSPQSAWQPPNPMWLENNGANEGVNLVGFLHSLRRRWLPGLLIGGLLATVIAALMWLFVPASYEAVGLIRVSRSVQPLLSSRLPPQSDQEYSVFKQTQPALIKSPFILNMAMRDPKIQTLKMIQREEKPIAWLEQELQVAYIGTSELMRVAIKGDDTKEPIEVVNKVMDSYMENLRAEGLESDSRKLALLQRERDNITTQMRQKIETINRLGLELGSDDNTQAKINNELELSKLRRLDRRLEDLRDEMRSLANQLYLLRVLRSSRVTKINPLDIEDHLEMDGLYFQRKMIVQSIEDQLKEMAAAAPGNSAVQQQLQNQLISAQQDLKARREELEPRIVNRLRRAQGYDENMELNNITLLQADLQGKKQVLDELETEYQDQLDTVKSMALANSELDVAKEELKAFKRTSAQLDEEIDRVRLNMQAEDRIKILQPAVIPDMSNLKVKLLGIAAAWMGVMGLTIFGFAMWDYLGKHLNTTSEVEKDLKLKVLGTLPALRGGVTRLVSGAQGETVIADSIDSVRAAITFGNKGREYKSVVVTSAVGREGKTTVASQLAVSMARAGKRTLLIDGDLRNPQQHAMFGLPPERGLAEVLRGEAQLEEVIQSTPAESLWILPAGHCDMTSLQALAGTGIGIIMDWCADQFDQVIVDAGPALVGAEAMIYGQHVDGVVLSARRDLSRMPKLEEAARRMSSVGVRVLGVVVNGATPEVRRNQMALVAK